MADYKELADKAKAIQDSADLPLRTPKVLESDPGGVFYAVTACIDAEMSKANAELRKRGVSTIARNHLPNFEGVIFLAIGTASLCRVELETRRGISRIKATLSGPPNGYESSRKEYLVGQEASGLDAERSGRAGLPTAGARPEQIAEDIISGILVGKFD